MARKINFKFTCNKEFNQGLCTSDTEWADYLWVYWGKEVFADDIISIATKYYRRSYFIVH